MIQTHSQAAGRSTGVFLRHLLEMVLAMVAGMLVLGGLVRLCVTVVGEAGLYEHTSVSALIMTVNMTIGMSIWMRHRGHGPLHIAEMAGAMFVPLAVLIYPFWAGLLTRAALMGGMHALMIPAMAGIMLYRLDVYARHHHAHSHGADPAVPAVGD